MRSWRGLYVIISTFITAVPQMANIGFLLLLTSFMFSLLGMQLIGGIYSPEAGYYSEEICDHGGCPAGLLDKPRSHFDYCGPAMLSVFVVLSGEWYDVMEPATALLGPAASIFFVAIVVVGKYFLTNLLVAVLLTEFGDRDGVEGEGTHANGGGGSSTLEAKGKRSSSGKSLSFKEKAQQRLKSASGYQQLEDEIVDTSAPAWEVDETAMLHGPVRDTVNLTVLVKLDSHWSSSGTLAAFQLNEVRGVAQPSPTPFGPYKGLHMWHIEVFSSFSTFETVAKPRTAFRIWDGHEIIALSPELKLEGTNQGSYLDPVILVGKSRVPPWPVDYSLFCFNRVSCLRRGCRWLLSVPLVDQIILVAITVSSICLALDSPRLDQTSELAATLRDLGAQTRIQHMLCFPHIPPTHADSLSLLHPFICCCHGALSHCSVVARWVRTEMCQRTARAHTSVLSANTSSPHTTTTVTRSHTALAPTVTDAADFLSTGTQISSLPFSF